MILDMFSGSFDLILGEPISGAKSPRNSWKNPKRYRCKVKRGWAAAFSYKRICEGARAGRTHLRQELRRASRAADRGRRTRTRTRTTMREFDKGCDKGSRYEAAVINAAVAS